MALINYHHHTIVSTPVCDDNTGMWKSNASVTWPETGNARGSRFFTHSPQLFRKFEDAEQAGLEAGKNFVDSGFQRARQAKLPNPSKQKSPSRGFSG